MRPRYIILILPLALLLIGAGCEIKRPSPAVTGNMNRAPVDVPSKLAQNPQGPAELQGIIATCYRRPAKRDNDGTIQYPQATCFLDNALRLQDRRLCDFIAMEAVNQAGKAMRTTCESGMAIPDDTP